MNLDRLNDTARAALSDAVQLFQKGQQPELSDVAQTGGGYRLVMVGYNGCASSHDYRNLNRVQDMGVSVEYINVNMDHSPVRPPLPFREIPTRSWQDARRLTDRYGLGPDAAMMALVGPNNRTIRIMDSNSRNFPDEVMREIDRQRGNGRSASLSRS